MLVSFVVTFSFVLTIFRVLYSLKCGNHVHFFDTFRPSEKATQINMDCICIRIVKLYEMSTVLILILYNPNFLNPDVL